ncbi:MAG: hydrogenase accessory protein [Alphaproteobacteria bacterium]|jgi:hydrogenase-1 operon protein HyaE|nr:hydrogenase accessory protein [Alphaproteobacteria bacterium]
MSHPLLTRLTDEMGWPHLADADDLAAHLAQPGLHCLFIPGDPARNLETGDAAVILPELQKAFRDRFDCALVGDAIEAGLREATRVLKTPGFLFYDGDRFLGGIAKIRDWDDYMARVPQILSTPAESDA